MTDAEDLARRYLNLWQDYLTALMADLRGPGLLQIWIAAYSALAGIRRRVTRPRSSKPGRPDRRLAPRPLPAHLASAMILWLTPRAALPVLKTVLLPGSVSGRQLHDVTAEIEALGTESVERAVEAATAHRVECYLAGLEAYRRHRFRRHSVSKPVVWHEGTTRLLDYGRDARGPIVLVIPSLINRYYVLDLLPERSFLQHLANSGLRPLVIDWQAPGSQERHFDLADYIDGRLEAAFAALRRIADGPIAVVGYCMGGLLSLALALRRLRTRPKRLQQHSSQRQSCDHRSVTSA